ncbi:hypothetical protein EVG20_g6249 [Dentipellis fragilis]|uniref:TLC domain-containing protein n=1 Tax=Dentipellis fragilis TaxID=205917 RepID=A0A4Y9YPZ6_9AGAM|nr:hypothetical protein EVG20_g6249 [Dentipellis fragilis]
MDDIRLSLIVPYLPTIFLSFILWTILQYVASPVITERVVGRQEWRVMNARTRNLWATHIVSMAHAFVAVPLALRCLDSPVLDADRAFAWDAEAGGLYAIAAGYFLWDTVESLVHYEDAGFIVHGVACLGIYTLAFRPFLGYYGARFLLWEMSTPFLNIHWFLDKTGRTGTTLQLVNGIALLGTFAGVRLIYGGLMSYHFLQTLREVHHEIPLLFTLAYGIGNVILQSLNWVCSLPIQVRKDDLRAAQAI